MTEILVLGATGKTGRRVTDRLAASGVHVRAASRNPGAATQPGVTPVRFDWHDVSTHDAALDGASAVYVIPPEFVVDHVDAVTAFVGRAEALGVQRAVFLSARGVDMDDTIPLRREELVLLGSGLGATVVRPSWFHQNFTEGVFAEPVRAGVLAAPAADGLEPFIDADDIADVVVAALTDDRHAGQAYDLSGPEAITWGAAAGILGRAFGREVAYVDADPGEWEAGLVAAGLPVDYAAMLGSLFAVIRNGWDAQVSDGVQKVLGRSARSFEDWASTIS
jgi:uncharacterized protein YbjT (DUF2867 family)